MSKQSKANDIFNSRTGLSRKAIIAEIVARVGVKPAYASTLYNNAKKKSQDASVLAVADAATVTVTKPVKSADLSDKATLKQIRADLRAALELVEKKHGVTFEQGNIRYDADGSNFRMKLECNAATTKSGVNSEKATWDKNCFLFGLKPEQFGTTFTTGRGTKYTIVGLNPRAKKNCIIGRSARGTDYIFPARVLS